MTEFEFKAANDILNDLIGIYTKQHDKRPDMGLKMRIKELISIKSLIKNNYADVALARLKAESHEVEIVFLLEKIKQLESLNAYKSDIIKAAEKKLDQYEQEWRCE